MFRGALISLALVLIVNATSSTRAEDFSWVGDKGGITSGATIWSFQDPAFWLDDAVPGFAQGNDGDLTNDDAVVGGPYNDGGEPSPFALGSGGTIVFGDFQGTLSDPNAAPVFYGAANVVNRSLRVESGSWTFDFDSNGISGESGSYTIEAPLMVDAFQRGGVPTPELTITGDGTFSSRGAVIGAANEGSLRVSGGAHWVTRSDDRDDISVNNGLVLVETGSSLENHGGSLLVGVGALKRGVVGVVGSLLSGERGNIVIGSEGAEGLFAIAGGQVENSSDLIVGEHGNAGAQAIIQDGRLTNEGNVNVGVDASGELTSTNSIVRIDGALTIGGDGGHGSVTIGSEGYDSFGAATTTIGRGVGSFGELHLTKRVDSWWGGDVTVGEDRGVGLLATDSTLWAYSNLFASSVTVGATGGTGLMALSGGGLFIVEHDLSVGGTGAGSGSYHTSGVAVFRHLDVYGRGDARIAEDSNSDGHVIVRDSARWTSEGTLNIGRGGVGQLDIVQGSVANRSTEAGSAVGQGEIRVGDSGVWAISESLTLTRGSLSVTDGGLVTIGHALSLGANGIVDVSKAGKVNIGAGDPGGPGTIRVGAGGLLAGTGTVVGDVIVDGGEVIPGFSPGALRIDGNFTLGATSILNFEIGGPTAGTEYDQLQVSGDLSLGGTVQLSLINGYQPFFGEQFEIFSVSGAFHDLGARYLSDPATGWSFQASYENGALVVTAVPEASSLTFGALAGVLGVFAAFRKRTRKRKGTRAAAGSLLVIGALAAGLPATAAPVSPYPWPDYSVLPILFSPTDWSIDSQAVQADADAIRSAMLDINEFYGRSMGGLTFRLNDLEVVQGWGPKENYGIEWTGGNIYTDGVNIVGNVEAAVVAELHQRGYPTPPAQNESGYSALIFVKGAGGWAGGRSFGGANGGWAILGDWCIDSLAGLVPEGAYWWSGRNLQMGAAAHELGHTFDLPHPDPYAGDWDSTVMGHWWNYPSTGLNAWEQNHILSGPKAEFFTAVPEASSLALGALAAASCAGTWVCRRRGRFWRGP